MTRPQLSRVLTRAARVVARDGLLKGDYGTVDGPKCAVGAVRFAYCGNPQASLPLMDDGTDLTTLLRETRPRSKRDNLVDFSDAERTRKHDVVELLLDMADQALR